MQDIRTVEECLELLLMAHTRHVFDPSVGKKATASPIDPNLTLFYVVEPAEGCIEGTKDDICVKYNGFTRAQVWWSPKYDGLYGLVCRKMALKPRKGSARHGYSGYWFLLAQRNQASMEERAPDAGALVVPGAPTLVQFWSVAVHGSKPPPNFFGASGFGASLPLDSPPSSPRTEAAGSADDVSRPPSAASNRTAIPGAAQEFEAIDMILDDPDMLELEESGDAAMHTQQHSPLPQSLCTEVGLDMMQQAIRTMTDDEFERWFVSSSHDLCSNEISRAITMALRQGDARVSADFMFSESCDFVPGLPIGSAMYCGTYATGFTVTDSDDAFKLMIGCPNPEGQLNLYERIVESKVSLMLQHIYFKEKLLSGRLDRTDFWFHNIVRNDQGKRMVIRHHSKVVGQVSQFAGLEQVQTRLRIQDVSHLYRDVLALGPLVPQERLPGIA